ncbi:PLC-like phosphodiesterase [Karstenula rhodostoma CBS 690.94]|uniref:PLC-like phosphodiesterase n=1 Tax=Karstenula rhodostoma CBS 690.94 TaxID=1392251 RepID=A0A9P4U812_9PLEO|nr:PLC-like phosphodiesterase [Karstenula rhodostoma CBS 690.94]
MVYKYVSLGLLGLQIGTGLAARQPYDVRKIIEAFKKPHDDLTILCAHRGLRWNGTAENSVDAYWRAAEAGIECIETDMRLSKDYFIPMIHDGGLGRVTDAGEQAGKEAYNPYTGKGYDPKVKDVDYAGYMENLHLRDEMGRVRVEKVPTLPDMVQAIHKEGINVVLELDFKDQAAVEPAYWALRTLKNAAGVPANEWCIYKLQATWYKTPEDFEALPWVQNAFASGVQLAFIPVYDPSMQEEMDTLASLKAFSQTNYTISAEIELRSTDGVLQDLLDYVKGNQSTNVKFKTAGTFYAPGDIFAPGPVDFDRANYTFPDDEHRNNSVYTFQDNKAPRLMDSLLTEGVSIDGHDYRSDFDWIVEQGYDWVITDTPDMWAKRLEKQGRRNITRMLADGKDVANGTLVGGWYKRD